jgi:predicted porin
MWQGQLGADFANLSGGTLSLDGIASYAKDGVNTSIFNGTWAVLTKGPFADQLAAKYKWGPMTFYGGYEYFSQGNPSHDYPNGFETIGGYSVPGNILNNKKFLTVWITTNAYNVIRIENIFWVGAKYAVNDSLDLIGAYYYIEQNDFLQAPAVCTGTGIHISSANCAGSYDTVSFLVDYRPVKRVDLYAGVALSNVYGGLANGCLQTQNIDPTVGLRIKF